MKPDELEKKIRNAKNDQHLTRDMLLSYIEQTLDYIRKDFTERHLKACFICSRHLTTLQEEKEMLENLEITEEHRQLGKETVKEEKTSLSDRLMDYLKQLTLDWKEYIRPLQIAAARGDEDIWTWQSRDGILNAKISLQVNQDLSFLFVSNNLKWEGHVIRFKMGDFTRDLKLELRPGVESEIYAEVVVPLEERVMDMTDISIDEL